MLYNNAKGTYLFQSYATPGLLELLCLYGYSLAIYIPVTFLWTIQIEWLQWSLVAIATFLSGGVLLRSLLPLISGIIYIYIYVRENNLTKQQINFQEGIG